MESCNTAFFDVVTVPMVSIMDDPMGKGYSWGFITFKLDDTRYRLLFSGPEERNNVQSLQKIPAVTLDRANKQNRTLDLSVDDPLASEIYTIRDPQNPWSKKIYMPSDILKDIDKYADDMIYYLRRIVSSDHDDPAVYAVPSGFKLRDQVKLFKETQKKRVL